MTNVSLELPLGEKQRFPELLTAAAQQRRPLKSIEQLVAEQGTKPLDFEELPGDFWPEDESIDDFLAAWRTWRSEGESPGLE